MTDDRRQPPHRGVMGYIAEFQQFDDTVVSSPADAWDRPEPRDGFIDLGIPRPAPVTHRGERRGRKTMLWVAAAAALTGGIGYAVLRGPGPEPAKSSPPVAAESPPPVFAEESLPGESAVPGLEPVATTRATSPARTTPTTAAAEPDIAAPTPSRVRVTTTPAPSPTATPSATQRPALTATYTFVTDEAEGVITGYAGTVRIANASAAGVADWTVRLVVPDAGEVTIRTGEVAVSRNGTAVTFTPAAGAGPVPAAGTVSFTFDVAGTLAALPSGCTVDGLACG